MKSLDGDISKPRRLKPVPLAIHIDRSACHGAQECVRRAPGTFSLDAAGRSRASESPADDEATIRAAARACPFFAIAVRDLAESEVE